MNVLKTILALSLVAAVSAKGAFEATDKNFQSEVLDSGKNAFVKFLAPWCGHCKSMKPDWDKLGQKYSSSDSVMIVDVDCTVHEKTCQQMGVQGYPTIKYFMAGDKKGKDYQQGRDYNSLAAFVEKTLNKPTCDAVTKKGCAVNEVAFIEKHSSKSAEELGAEIASKGDDIKALKAEKKEAESEWKAKEKEFKKKEKLHTKGLAILKQLEKAAS